MRSPSKIKVCHITTVHPVLDTRIFYKECASLCRFGFDTYLIVRHDKNEVKDGIHIIALPNVEAKGWRRFVNMWRAFREAVELDAKVYHFHDPELLPVGILLSMLTRAKVIYDVHENVKTHALGKSWMTGVIRFIVAYGLRFLEILGTPFFNAVVIAAPCLSDSHKKAILVRNYPVVPERLPELDRSENSRKQLVYLGVIRRRRAPFELLAAMKILKQRYPDILLNLIGAFFPPRLEDQIKGYVQENELEENVYIPGRVDVTEGHRIIHESDIGLCILYPDPNYLDALPTKMFEYMLYEKPVVVSRFPLWQSIVEEASCGVTVDGLSPRKIARAIISLYENPEEMEKMGQAGQRAVLERYNWQNEERKLIACYQNLV